VFVNRRFVPLIALIICTLLLMIMPENVIAAEDVLNYPEFKHANYFDAEYEVSSTIGTVSATEEKILISATGKNKTDECGSKDVSSTTTLTLTAKQTVSVTCSYSNTVEATIEASITSSENGWKSFTLAGGDSISFTVKAMNGTEVPGEVAFHSVEPAVLLVPDDCARYSVGNNYYEYLDEAVIAAGSEGMVVVYKSGTVYHSSYENDVEGYASKRITFDIPSNVKLLLPYSASDVSAGGNFDEKPKTNTTSKFYYNTQSVYSELYIPSNTTINCSGQICVDSEVFADTLYSGCPGGPHGRVVLEEGSILSMKSGSTLYCYGYITGVWDSSSKTYTTGIVEAQTGSTIYESFQALGWRGGTLMKLWMNAGEAGTAKSFGFSDYALQNIESKLQVNNGATLKFVASLEGSNTIVQVSGTFISNSAGFLQMGTDGSVLRSFDPYNNRIQYSLSGKTLKIGNVAMTLGSMGSVDSQYYIFGLNPSMDIVINSDANVTLLYDYKIMPGATVTINQNGKATVNGNIYIYDTADYVIEGLTYAHHQSYTWLKSVPVSYIAATGYRSDGFGQVWNQGISQISASTPSGKMVVNGELIIASSGGVYTSSNGGMDANKVITGTGTIINNSTANEVVSDALDETYTVYRNFLQGGSYIEDQNKKVTPAVGLIKGLSTSASDYHCFEAGKTYHGSSDGYWYEYTISTVTDGGEPVVAGYVGNGSAITFNESNVASSLNSVNGSYTFDTSDYIKVESNNGTLIDNGDGTYTLTDVTADTTVTMITKCNIAATNVKAGDSLDLFFYVPKVRLNNLKTELGFTNYNATVIRKDPLTGNNVETTTDNYDSWEEYGTEYLRFKVTDIAAKEMNDIVSVTLYGISGDSRIPISNTCQESVALYAYRVLESLENQESLDDKDVMLRTTVVDMLEYGSACQTSFDYNSSELANAELTTEQKLYASANVTPDNNHCEGANFVRSSVSTKERLVYTFYFENIAESMLSNMSAVVTYTDHNGREVTRGITGNEFTYNKDYSLYGVDVKGLAIADGCQLIECVVKSGSEEFGRGTGSVESYLAAGSLETAGTTANEKTVYQKLMNFIDSAYRYFHDGDAPPEYENQAESMNVNEETEEVIDEAV